ncbi:hypothetical protein E8E14_008171 [Neopestalotiopsis sp. 37M]|nr:hypothetical protein E8E14_008171 [Neopestalotiopsis sp. 37M]
MKFSTALSFYAREAFFPAKAIRQDIISPLPMIDTKTSFGPEAEFKRGIVCPLCRCCSRRIFWSARLSNNPATVAERPPWVVTFDSLIPRWEGMFYDLQERATNEDDWNQALSELNRQTEKQRVREAEEFIKTKSSSYFAA